jgi:hypothetical protein
MIMNMVAETPTKTSITFTQALERAELVARQALPPEAHERLSAAVAIVRSGGVFQDDQGHWEVSSTSEPGKVWSVNGSCSCPDSVYRGRACKHRMAVRLAKLATTILEEVAQTPTPALDDHGWPPEAMPVAGMPADPPVPAPAHPEAVPTGKRIIPAHYIQQLQGKPFIKYTGLLQMAHEERLTSLTEEWPHNDPELSLAHAVATFADGRVFAGSGDSTPQNAKNIGLAWRRMALTRSKARALRDALGIDMAAVEEME